MLFFVLEYLIRNTGDHGWPPVHASRLSEVLVPVGGGWQIVDGLGDLVIERSGVRVAFSGEMEGWQVAVYGMDDEDVARQLVDEVAGQVGAEVGQPVEVLPI